MKKLIAGLMVGLMVLAVTAPAAAARIVVHIGCAFAVSRVAAERLSTMTRSGWYLSACSQLSVSQ